MENVNDGFHKDDDAGDDDCIEVSGPVMSGWCSSIPMRRREAQPWLAGGILKQRERSICWETYATKSI